MARILDTCSGVGASTCVSCKRAKYFGYQHPRQSREEIGFGNDGQREHEIRHRQRHPAHRPPFPKCLVDERVGIATRKIANAAIAAGQDRALANDMALFMYRPFGYSENLTDQDRTVALAQRPKIAHARLHRDIIRRFGRFPHRNPILGQTMGPEEQFYLDHGGFSG